MGHDIGAIKTYHGQRTNTQYGLMSPMSGQGRAGQGRAGQGRAGQGKDGMSFPGALYFFFGGQATKHNTF